MKTTLSIVTGLFLLLTAACGGNSGDSTDAAGGDTADAGTSAAVEMSDLSYKPGEVSVGAGSEVTWTNADDVPHTVTFEDDSVTSSEQIPAGDTFAATFAEAGTYSYTCAIHPDMKGTVTVS